MPYAPCGRVRSRHCTWWSARAEPTSRGARRARASFTAHRAELGGCAGRGRASIAVGAASLGSSPPSSGSSSSGSPFRSAARSPTRHWAAPWGPGPPNGSAGTVGRPSSSGRRPSGTPTTSRRWAAALPPEPFASRQRRHHDAHHCNGRRTCRPPSPLTPFASPAVAGEGQWSPIGRTVRRNTRGLRDDAPTRRHSHELRRRCRLDGHQAPQSHALLGQRHPRRWPLHAHRTHLAERRHLTRRCLQRWLLDVRRQWRLLHRRQDHPSPANRCSLLRGLQERLVHRRAVGARRLHGQRASPRCART